jgi:hypothetical protein
MLFVSFLARFVVRRAAHFCFVVASQPPAAVYRRARGFFTFLRSLNKERGGFTATQLFWWVK